MPSALLVAYPLHIAEKTLENLEGKAARLGANVYIGPLEKSPHGDEYRGVRADATRIDWARVKALAHKEGWKNFGGEGLVYDLPDHNFVVIEPHF